MARAFRCLLLLPLAVCLWRLWILTKSELAWGYLIPLTALLPLVVLARLLTPWVRAFAVRARGQSLLRRTGVTAGFACDVALLAIFGAFFWGERETVAMVLVVTQLYALWALIALGLLSCYLATRDVAALARERNGDVVLFDGDARRVLSMHRVDQDVTILDVDGRSSWRIATEELATFDVLASWVRER